MQIVVTHRPGWEDLERRVVSMMSKSVLAPEDIAYLKSYGFHPNDIHEAVDDFHREINRIAKHIKR